jgi:hypothetical protein
LAPTFVKSTFSAPFVILADANVATGTEAPRINLGAPFGGVSMRVIAGVLA